MCGLFLFIYLFIGEGGLTIPGGAQDLFMALYSGMTLCSAWDTLCDALLCDTKGQLSG